MTTIDRSILRQLTVVALFSGVTMLLILAFVKASGLLLLFASTAVSWGTLGELLLFSLPDLAGLLVPLLTFGTVLWVYARMADDRELVVLSGAGASPWRLGRPALLFAAVMTLVGWTLMLWLVPLSYGAFKDREYEIRSGLASALLPVLEARGGAWVAMRGPDEETPLTQGYPDEAPAFTVRRVPLEAPEYEAFYQGMANRVLWPLSHYLVEYVEPDRGFRDAYRAVNRRFAHAALDVARAAFSSVR